MKSDSSRSLTLRAPLCCLSIFYAKLMKFDAKEDPSSSEDSFRFFAMAYSLRNNIRIRQTGGASGILDELRKELRA